MRILLAAAILCGASVPAPAFDKGDCLNRYKAKLAEAKGRAPGNETDAIRKKAAEILAQCNARTVPQDR